MEDIIQVEKKASRRGGRARRSVAVVLSGAMLGLGALVPAAFAVDTSATFTLTGGLLSIDADPTATLAPGAPGDASVAGSLGIVTVSDARGSAAGWVTSRASSAFTGPGDDILSSAVTYTPGTLTSSVGEVTPVAGATGVMTTPQTAFSGTLAVGNNEASWTPDITVDLPDNALAGIFTGTITHSVI